MPSNSTYALSYKEDTFTSGEQFKLITGSGNGFAADGSPLPFATYEEAAAFINANPGYVIVGTNPFVSPIPLEALQQYKLIYSSPTAAVQEGTTSISEVEIFEYTGYKK